CGYLRDPSVDESIPFDTTAVLANTSHPLPGPDSDPNTQFMVKDSKEATFVQPPDSADSLGVAPNSGCLSSEVGEPIGHHDRQSMLSADWPELDSAGQPQSLLPQPSPPGIHLSELKTELHKPSVTGLHSQSVTHHRSVAPTLSNPDHPYPSDQLHASYLFGSHLPVALDVNRTALSSPGPSSGMTPMEFPMLVDSTGSVHTSMPSSAQKQFSQVTEAVETIVAPASTGMKRRLLGTSHQSKQSHDYLRTLQHPGGSLDRRWDFDFLTSPKRKIYQEWLPKVTAFSRKAAVTMLQAVHSRETRSHDTGKSETEPPVIVSSPGLLDLSSVSPTSPRIATAPQIPSAPMSTHSSTAASLGNMDQESDDHFDEDAEDLEEERECQLAPLQSHLALPTRTRSTFTSLPVGSMEPTSPLLPLYVPDHSQQAPTQFTGSRLPATYPTSSSFPLTVPTDFQSPTLMFFHPGDDDDDLAEIDRVNRRLAMSGVLIRRHRTTTTWEKYRLLRNKVNTLVVNDKKDYQLMLLEKMEKNPKLLYWIINNKASVKPGISPLHTPNGLTATASAAAEELADFYSTVYCQKEYISRMSFMSPSPPTSLHEVIVTPECVLRTLLELNHRKSPGADQITPFILKQCAHSLCTPLAELFNSSLNDGVVPTDWKRGVITPLYK
ncbi:hypothetical protein X801_06906, partial [Opisthorchis viverrini]